MSEECSICVEKYNKTNKCKITCFSCNYEYCKTCFKRLIMENNDEICPMCSINIPYSFIESNMTKQFMNNEYYEKQLNKLLNQEKNLIPYYQNAAKIYLDEKKNKKEQINIQIKILDNKYLLEKDKLLKLYTNDDIKVIRHNTYELNNKLLKTKRDLQTLQDQLQFIFSGQDTFSDYIQNDSNQEQENLCHSMIKCPRENCQGYIYKGYKCSTCDQYICSKCHEKKESRIDQNHICNPDTVLSLNFIKKDTKNCPKCGIPIHKIHGCSHMWCIKCHCMFCWNTLRIQTTTTNPHYYEWRNQNNINQNNQISPHQLEQLDIQTMLCEFNVENAQIIIQYIEHLFRFNKSNIDSNCYNLIIQLTRHIMLYELPYYNPAKLPLENIKDRIYFIVGEITENDWKKKLKLFVRKDIKFHQIYQILITLIIQISDILNLFINKHENITPLLNQIKTQINNEFLQISKKYNSTSIFITDRWKITGFNK